MSSTLASTVNRMAAALVALALSGAPALLDDHHDAHPHRCQCPVRDGQHDCACPLCHAAAARARPADADDPNLPPCHRALARKARQAEDSGRARREAETHVAPLCSADEQAVETRAAPELFLRPAGAPPPPAPRSAPLTLQAAAPTERSLEPETPPPRLA